MPEGGISVTSHKSQVTSHKSQVTSHKSQVTSHKSLVTSHQSQVTSHKSPVTSHKSQVTSDLDLRIRRHAGISGIPDDDFSGGEAFLYVDGALVRRAFEEEGDVFLVEHEFPIDEDVDALQELHCFRHDFGKVAEKITVEEVAGEAPDGFLRVALLETRDEGEEAFLIGGLHGFAAQKGEAFVVFVSDLV